MLFLKSLDHIQQFQMKNSTRKHWFGYSFRGQCSTVQVSFTDKKIHEVGTSTFSKYRM